MSDPHEGRADRPAVEPVTIRLRRDVGGPTGGLELRFLERPPATIRNRLKSEGWRWHHQRQCWYTKATGKALDTAQDIKRLLGA